MNLNPTNYIFKKAQNLASIFVLFHDLIEEIGDQVVKVLPCNNVKIPGRNNTVLS